MSENAEIVIIGAGVAGAAMAITLARRGLSVLVLETNMRALSPRVIRKSLSGGISWLTFLLREPETGTLTDSD
jgi:flavin-dependent dehydrogenase